MGKINLISDRRNGNFIPVGVMGVGVMGHHLFSYCVSYKYTRQTKVSRSFILNSYAL